MVGRGRAARASGGGPRSASAASRAPSTRRRHRRRPGHRRRTPRRWPGSVGPVDDCLMSNPARVEPRAPVGDGVPSCACGPAPRRVSASCAAPSASQGPTTPGFRRCTPTGHGSARPAPAGPARSARSPWRRPALGAAKVAQQLAGVPAGTRGHRDRQVLILDAGSQQAGLRDDLGTAAVVGQGGQSATLDRRHWQDGRFAGPARPDRRPTPGSQRPARLVLSRDHGLLPEVFTGQRPMITL